MWFKHPNFISAKQHLISQFKNIERSKKSSDMKEARSALFGRSALPKLLFICGGDPMYCKRRGEIENYLSKHAKHLLTFRAEYAWETISNTQPGVNALELEEWLADLSDAVIIIVESFGTVAELGAFSLSKPLRSKLLPILDKRYADDESFINTGPVRWVDQDSVYSPTIYADFDTILTSLPEVLDRINSDRPKFYNSREGNKTIGSFLFSKKEMLFVIILIITSIGPVNDENIIDICKKSFGIIKKSDINEIKLLISLCIALEIIEPINISGNMCYTCHDYTKLYNTSTTSHLLNTSQKLRGACVSKLIYIEEYVHEIKRLKSNAS
ncbi:retron St85 family effector protein [Vibrio antiquarius]|uniref:retron St85 family effector protein n=1 Tax=Vibrio antiquarius (strain Ex25) TaxID=150340 RepID=UPI002658B752|nr:retron St85 family effector protein [Vibrio antiquarius]MCS0024569.1 retron St85 family effector protein [Vibrio antiquarius]